MGMIQPSQHMEDVGGGGVQKSVRQPHRIAQELKRGDANELGVDKNVLSDSKGRRWKSYAGQGVF